MNSNLPNYPRSSWPSSQRLGLRRGTARWAVLRIWYAYAVALLLYGVVGNLLSAEAVPLLVQLPALLIAATCLLPLVLWTARGRRGLPMFEMICVAYLLAFGVPIYLQANSINILSRVQSFTWDQTFETLLLAELGIIFLIVGYYAAHRSRVLTTAPKLDLPFTTHGRRLYLQIAVGVGALIIALQALDINLPGGGLAAFTRLFFVQIYIAIIVLAYRFFQREANSREKAMLWFAVGLAALYGLAAGVLENVLVPFVLLFIARWHVTRKFPTMWLLVGMLLFFVLNSVKGNYRQETWSQENNLSFGQRIGLWLGMSQNFAEQTVSGDDSNKTNSAWRGSMQRFDLLHQFVYVRERTPAYIPYFEGSTYGYLFYGWIPRFLWPDKPSASIATDTLALRYDLITENQVGSVSIGIGFLPESYANFGAWGIVVIMFLQGMFLAAISALLNGPQSEGGRAIYLSIMIFFLNGIGAATAILFSSIIPGIIGSALILKPFVKGWSVAPSRKTVSRRSSPVTKTV